MLEWLAYYWPTILVCLALGGRVRNHLLDGAQPQKGKDLLRL